MQKFIKHCSNICFIPKFLLYFVIKSEILPIIIGFDRKKSAKQWMKHWSNVSRRKSRPDAKTPVGPS